MNNQQNNIGSILTALRKEAGLTQKELAARIGVDHSVVSNWERGINKYDIEMLIPLSKVLDVSVNDLLGFYTDYSLNPDEKKLIKMFRELEEPGNQLIINTAEALLSYKKSNLADLDPAASELLEIYFKLPDDIQKNLLEIVKSLERSLKSE